MTVMFRLMVSGVNPAPFAASKRPELVAQTT